MDLNCLQIVSQRWALSGYASSLIGGRPENQDDMGWTDTPLGFLLVVCDGMGGGPGGRTASYLAKTTVMQTVLESSEQADRKSVLKMAVSCANDILYEKMEQVPSLRGMGSTLVAILINEQSAVIAHLGDSRCYRLHGSQVLFRTNDHSLVGELMRNKVLTEEEARRSPQSNVITRGLGNTSNHVAEIDEVPFRKGDRFVLCSDGVWGAMPHPELTRRMTTLMNVQAIVSNLQIEVNRRGVEEGGHFDNHTLAIIEMNMDSIMKDKMSKQIRIILGSLSILLLVSMIFNIVCLIKLGNAPQREAYEKLALDFKTMKQENDVLRSSLNTTEYDRILQIEELKIRNSSLEQELTDLSKLVNSLRDSLNSMPKTATVSSSTVSSPKGQKEEVEEKTEARTAQEVATQILQKYDQLKKVKEKKLADVIKKTGAIKDEIADELDELGRLCKNPRRTNHIKNLLPDNDRISKNINQHNNYFFPNSYLIGEFEKSEKKLIELKKDLK